MIMISLTLSIINLEILIKQTCKTLHIIINLYILFVRRLSDKLKIQILSKIAQLHFCILFNLRYEKMKEIYKI